MNKQNIEKILMALRNGDLIILTDDQTRENEGDIVIAAEKITAEKINFLAQHARGLICLSLSGDLADQLKLTPQTSNNHAKFATNFTVSIEARYGVSTGISAKDRATTILAAIRDHATAEDLVSPGHIFPIRATDGGVLQRRGHTEGSVDLMGLAGLKRAAVICEIMNTDGTMARTNDLAQFAEKYNLPICSISEILKYRLNFDSNIVKMLTKTSLPTKFGNFQMYAYENTIDHLTHLALIKGTLDISKPIPVRIHSECMTGDVFASKRCDCGEQLHAAMHYMQQAEQGIIIYLRQEGRGIGLANKIKAYALQEQGLDTVEANNNLGFAADLRDYGIAAQILRNLGVSQIKLLTNNPQKIADMEFSGLRVIERIPLITQNTTENFLYLQTKRTKMHHLLDINSD